MAGVVRGLSAPISGLAHSPAMVRSEPREGHVAKKLSITPKPRLYCDCRPEGASDVMKRTHEWAARLEEQFGALFKGIEKFSVLGGTIVGFPNRRAERRHSQ